MSGFCSVCSRDSRKADRATILSLSVTDGTGVKLLVRLDTKDGRSQLKGLLCKSVPVSPRQPCHFKQICPDIQLQPMLKETPQSYFPGFWPSEKYKNKFSFENSSDT